MSKPKLAIVTGSIRPNRFGGEALSQEQTMTLPVQLFTPIQLGRYTLPNRLVMSPMSPT
jgi:hypothetical protein